MSVVVCAYCQSMNETGRFCSNCSAPLEVQPATSNASQRFEPMPAPPALPEKRGFVARAWPLLVVAALAAVLWSAALIVGVNHKSPAPPPVLSYGADPFAKPPEPPKPPTNDEKIQKARGLIEKSDNRPDLETAQALLAEIPKGAPEYKRAQALTAKANARLKEVEKRELEALREQLRYTYQLLLTQQNPHLNFIKVKYVPMKGGSALYGVHAFFTQNTFDIGGLAGEVQSWVSSNRADLKKAGIVRVGVMNESGWLGSAWFEVNN